LDSLVSVELLISVFYTNTPLHDGAVIIRNDRVIAASALLPLSRLGTGSYYLGTRHRAALGISEVTDAIVIVVSEETRMISVAYDGRMIRELDETRLLKVLKAFYRTRLITTPSNWSRFRQWLSSLHKQAQKQ
jgi:diadenylate cyclase